MRRWLGLTVLAVVLVGGVAVAGAQDGGNQLIVFETTMGDIVLELDHEGAPVTAAQVAALVEAGAYDGMPWVRIISGFIVQVGQVEVHRPVPLEPVVEALVRPLPLEVGSDDSHVRGTLSMARFDEPDSGTSSFSIVVAASPHLDGQYTTFGQVTDGMAIVDALNALPTDDQDVPLDSVRIDRARVVTRGELDQLGLNTQRPEFASSQASLTQAATESETTTAVTAALIGAFAFAMLAFFASGRLAGRFTGALALLAALAAGFGLYRVSVPSTSTTVGLIVFVAFFGLLRALSSFEAET